MDRLIEGFKKFRETYYEDHRDLFDTLAQGQAPRAMIVSCCDSRVDPTLIFNTSPGDVFVVRNVANLVPPYAPSPELHGTSAALEFAVKGLGVEHIIVLGHSRCGGVRALLEGRAAAGEFIGPWMAIARSARERAIASTRGEPPEVTQRCCEHETLKVSLSNLMTFPYIRERVLAGRMSLHAWYFDLEQASLMRLDERFGGFEPVTG